MIRRPCDRDFFSQSWGSKIRRSVAWPVSFTGDDLSERSYARDSTSQVRTVGNSPFLRFSYTFGRFPGCCAGESRRAGSSQAVD
jgi:hypothetical protein